MPTLTQIAEYWRDAAVEVFPGMPPHGWNWDDPFCFRCGWEAPTPSFEGPRWKWATGWLERAHLHERAAGGRDRLDNIVPLCPLCHRTMPVFRDGPGEAIAWIRERHPFVPLGRWQYLTYAYWFGPRHRPYPGWPNFLAVFHQVYLEEIADRHQAGINPAGWSL